MGVDKGCDETGLSGEFGKRGIGKTRRGVAVSRNMSIEREARLSVSEACPGICPHLEGRQQKDCITIY